MKLGSTRRRSLTQRLQLDESKTDVAEYMDKILGQLARIAKSHQLEKLAHTLATAKNEAAWEARAAERRERLASTIDLRSTMSTILPCTPGEVAEFADRLLGSFIGLTTNINFTRSRSYCLKRKRKPQQTGRKLFRSRALRDR